MEDLFGQHEQADEPGSGRYVRVAVERGIDAPARKAGLVYRAGQEVQVGDRVDVPLGRSRAGGIVICVGGSELLDGLAPGKVRAILRRAGPRLPAALIELAMWMAGYYVCPLGMVLAAMTPAAVKRQTGRRTRRVIDLPEGGLIDPMSLGVESLPPATARALEAIRGMDPGVMPMPAKELAAHLKLPNAGPINRLVRLGLLRAFTQTTVRSVDSPWSSLNVEASIEPDAPLTEDQARVVEGVGGDLGRFGVHLLHGVTSSGKTRVYIELIQRVIDAGGGAIVLVPEIALTPQTAGRFLRRFEAAGVAVLHSGLTASQRNAHWTRCARGEVRVVVGARSAVFAPLASPGLIVVDEEHDTSYKQDQLPRYHGRDVAIKRGQIQDCPVLLGSATPSLESWANAHAGDSSGRARYRLWRLPERVGGGRLPRIEVVDMARQGGVRSRPGGEGRGSGGSGGGGGGGMMRIGLIGPALDSALREALDAGGQAILLVNRRGYASFVACPDTTCGWVMDCEHCDSAMVYHRAGTLPTGGLLRCHHCLSEQIVPPACPLCGRRPAKLGIGTQRAEEELESRFPELVTGRTLLRVDSDSMSSARDYFQALSAFASGRVRVLVGTQMLAKGLDYPNVRLVGVLSADTALFLPDFRAGERTFQLVSQVAGRAGRGSTPGLVIVQTLCPESAAIRLAADHDYDAFAEQELAIRRRAGLPPAARMARIVVRDPDFDRARDGATLIASAIRDAARGALRIIGPAPCPISRIGGQYRVGIEVIASSAALIQHALSGARSAGLLKSDARTAVDVDPVALM